MSNRDRIPRTLQEAFGPYTADRIAEQTARGDRLAKWVNLALAGVWSLATWAGWL